MRGAVRQPPETPAQHDIAAQAGSLIRQVMRDWARTAVTLGRLRQTPLTDRAIAEVILAQRRVADSAQALREHAEALRAAGHLIEYGRQLGLAEAGARRPAREIPERRRAPLRSVKALALPLAALGGSAWHAARTHASRTAAAGLTAAVTAGGMTSLVVLAPRESPAATAPQRSVLVPAAASPAITPPARPAGKRRRRHHAPPPAPPAPARSPQPSRRPSPSPSAVPGTLLVSATVITLAIGGTGDLVLTASGGPVQWDLTAAPGITLSAASGTLRDGRSVTVEVTRTDARTGEVWAWPGGQAIAVTAR